jgi:hypothetical protein
LLLEVVQARQLGMRFEPLGQTVPRAIESSVKPIKIALILEISIL